MNQNTIHAADCRCSKCPRERHKRHFRFAILACLYVVGILVASAALVMGAAVQ